ncbi:hypothetical protein JOC54_004141 [Alkalihalobacillus xiaoxiensis]|uniref:Uncharacterized protein n=1 Tax=Shouchella xiaoxiensis TaxID=766895 RepID=A0ABS2SZA6_9BACI|nr:hypothetical protein [Shouchella xiaoxiensis]MBM7840848.1 hypothetical protein [Shouchella xiaoxiensis]
MSQKTKRLLLLISLIVSIFVTAVSPFTYGYETQYGLPAAVISTYDTGGGFSFHLLGLLFNLFFVYFLIRLLIHLYNKLQKKLFT